MKTTPAKRVTPEDYKAEYRDLITQLAQTLNNFLDQQSTLAQKNITLNDNLKCQVLSTTLQAGITSYKFTYTLNERPTAVTVANISRSDSSAFTAAYSMSWTYGDRSITVNFVGLDASKIHNITILAQV